MSARLLANPHRVHVVTFLIIFATHINILLIVKVKSLRAMKWII